MCDMCACTAQHRTACHALRVQATLDASCTAGWWIARTVVRLMAALLSVVLLRLLRGMSPSSPASAEALVEANPLLLLLCEGPSAGRTALLMWGRSCQLQVACVLLFSCCWWCA